LTNKAITESAVIMPVFGFSEGKFSIVIEKRAQSESTSMRCTLRVTVGSAQISTVVRSGPMPAGPQSRRERGRCYAATFARKRSTEARSCVAWLERSWAVARTMSAERLALSVASAVPAMLRATCAVPLAA
jgi:hypothetical protein